MADTTKIAWTDATFNPWIGCVKVHAGCTHCYAESFAKRTGKATWGAAGTRVKTSDANWKLPLKWNALAAADGVRKRVFCASLADVFEDWQGPVHDHHGMILSRELCDGTEGRENLTLDDLRAQLFRLIDATPMLDWQLLTKRPENVGRMWPQEDDGAGGRLANAIFGGEGKLIKRRDNVWIGTSISDQETADAWVPRLFKCRQLCANVFLSAEPLLGPIDLWQATKGQRICARCGVLGPDGVRCSFCDQVAMVQSPIDWLIIGGESGRSARPCKDEWIKSLVGQCEAAGVACFVKQMGENFHSNREWPDCPTYTLDRQGGLPHRMKNGRWKFPDGKGGEPERWPVDLRVRQMPAHPA